MGEKFKRNWKKVTGVRPDPELKVGDVLRFPESTNASGIGGIPVGDLSTMASGEILVYNGTEFVPGVQASGGGGAPTGSAGGDLSGTYPNPTVASISGVSLDVSGLTSGDALVFDGTGFVASGVATGGGGAPTGPAGGDLSGTYPNPTVSGIQNVEVAPIAPTNGQALIFDGTRYVPGTVSAGGLGTVILSSNGLTVGNSEEFVAVSGATSLNLPVTPGNGQRHYVKDVLGTAASANVTISGNGSNIDGLGTFVLGNNYESLTVIYESALGTWSVV